ncbi:bifunctional glutathionylspermidine amidase/synthase [bacterium]|nr:bifunctional glutathionylspermidine amidase/synthase [bacterium]
MMNNLEKKPANFGSLIGVAPGNVNIYSSDYESVDDHEMPDRSSFRSLLDGMVMGYKWQCVEFARRWLYLNKGYIFEDVPMAYDIFRLRRVHVIADGTELPLYSFKNGSRRFPEPGCLLIWDEGGEFERTGHVAIVTEVSHRSIRLVEQNFDNLTWQDGQAFSREIKAKVTEDGEYWIQCPFDDAVLLGWVIQTDDGTFAEEIVEVDQRLFNLSMKEAAAQGRQGISWLNMANEDEAAYVKAMGGHRLASRDEDRFKYFGLSTSALQEIRRASNELHALFMRATDHILRHDSLLERFNIPVPVWPRIRQSWNNRRNQMITGRLDFSISDRGVKVYEYNADSASCYLESGKIQGKWAAHHGVHDGTDPGAGLVGALVTAWKKSEVRGVLHIMQDMEPEETYHALFMKSILERAGIPCKIIHGVSGLSWDRKGVVIDADGLEIKWVWKTWAWETALDQIRAEIEEEDSTADSYAFDTVRDHPPRLVDVLLNKDVMVFEPLWTLIPSNKAILAIMWTMFPHHRYLLDTQFSLTDDLKRKGYAAKPIAGRCGCNISIVDRHNETVDETSGKFKDQDQIYQELWRLPTVGGYYAQVSTFMVAGSYAGSCVRVESSPVITKDSDVLPLRVLDDHEF